MLFHLLGDPESSSKDIQVDSKGDVFDLKNLVAAHFAIVESNGMLLTSSNSSLHDL